MHIGAQPVPPSLITHWRKYFPEMAYDQTFGLSESTGPNCVHLGIENIHKVGPSEGRDSTGRPVLSTGDGRTSAGDRPGELSASRKRGDAGVLQDPEATARALKDGWLYTGDMARQDEDGFIYIVDRKKDVIIVGGENVFPIEVENFLHTHPGVKDVAAIGYPDERLGEIVAVVIDVVPGKSLTEEEILQYCEKLPKYKRPRKIFFRRGPAEPYRQIGKDKAEKRSISGVKGHSKF